MTDSTKRGRPCYGFLTRGERERTQGTCSTCDLPAAAHQRIVFLAVTLPPLMAGELRDGAWTWPLDGWRGSSCLWRPATLVAVGIQRDAVGTSAFLGFQQTSAPELGGIRLLHDFDLAPRHVRLLVIAETFNRWRTEGAVKGSLLVFDDLDTGAFVDALGEAHATLELEAKVAGRGQP